MPSEFLEGTQSHLEVRLDSGKESNALPKRNDGYWPALRQGFWNSQGYSDADWAGESEARTSTGAFVFMLGSSTIYWRSCRQRSVALSSAEAEFVSLSDAAKELVWLRCLLSDLNVNCDSPTTLLVDNQTSMSWGTDGVRNAKHVAVRRKFVKELVEKNVVALKHCPTQQMTADVLTKPLSSLLNILAI